MKYIQILHLKYQEILITLILSLVFCLPTYAEITFHKNIDAMTDRDSSKVIVKQNNCKSNECEYVIFRADGSVILKFSRYIGKDDPTVEFRFDKGAIYKFESNVSSDGTGIFIRDADKVFFTQIFKKSNKMIVRSYNFRGVSKTVSYDLTGSTKALKKLTSFNEYINKIKE